MPKINIATQVINEKWEVKLATNIPIKIKVMPGINGKKIPNTPKIIIRPDKIYNIKVNSID